MAQTIFIFSGKFLTREKACLYTEEQWEEPKPDDSWSDEAWDAWEERNPSWQMFDDLDVFHMDSDFIETIFGDDKIEYIKGQLTNDEDRRVVEETIPADADTIVSIMSSAFMDKKVKFQSTDVLTYHGEYKWNAHSL